MMKKIYLATILAFLMASNVSLVAQPKNSHIWRPLKYNYGKKSIIDTTRLVVLYAFNTEDINDENTYIDFQRLEVGKHSHKYFSEFVRQSDSLLAEWHQKNPHAEAVPTFLGKGGKNVDCWSEYEFSHLFFADGEVAVYTTMPNTVNSNNYYKEAYPTQDWKIETDRQNILGYDCQKATTHWRGRTFIAWFATDIPVKAGPWKFGGLPGLILKLQDADHLYWFDAVQISSTATPMFKYEFKEYQKYTREKAWKLNQAVNENFPKVAGIRKCTFDEKGEPIIGGPVSRFTPYEALEKE